MKTNDTTAAEKYDVIAEEYSEKAEPRFVGYTRPAMLSLFPDVSGKRVLDAGCGPGWYASWLLDHDADVAAIDASREMVEQARARLGSQASVQQVDLGDPLPFADNEFDLIVSGLAFDYVEDWRSMFTELRQILSPNGILVFSVRHPLGGLELFDLTSYLEMAQVEEPHGKFENPVDIPSYHRPFEVIVNALRDEGFALDRLIEPKPTEELRERDPDEYKRRQIHPTFLCVRARNPDSA